MNSNPKVHRDTSPIPAKPADDIRLRVLQPLLNVLAVAGTVSLVYNLALFIPKQDWLSVSFYTLIFLGLIVAAFGKSIRYDYRVTITGLVIWMLGAFTFVLYGLNKNGVVFLLGFVFVNAILLSRKAG
ncbi:hypothetical protein FDZ74_04760, partial [bacterium]